MSTFTRFITAGVYANTDNNAVDFFIVAFADGTDAAQATASRTARPRNLLSPALTASDNSPVGMSTIKALMDAYVPDVPFGGTVAIEVEGNSAATEGATGDTLIAVINPTPDTVTYEWKRGAVSTYVTTVVGTGSTLVAAIEGYYVVTVTMPGFFPKASDPFLVKDAGIQDLSGTASIESDADGTSFVGATLTASYTGGESIVWQWYKNDEPLTGESANTLDTTSHGYGLYKAAATLDAHRNAYSNEIRVYPGPLPAFRNSDFEWHWDGTNDVLPTAGDPVPQGGVVGVTGVNNPGLAVANVKYAARDGGGFNMHFDGTVASNGGLFQAAWNPIEGQRYLTFWVRGTYGQGTGSNRALVFLFTDGDNTAAAATRPAVRFTSLTIAAAAGNNHVYALGNSAAYTDANAATSFEFANWTPVNFDLTDAPQATSRMDTRLGITHTLRIRGGANAVANLHFDDFMYSWVPITAP
jgi:hypothetical protein